MLDQLAIDAISKLKSQIIGKKVEGLRVGYSLALEISNGDAFYLIRFGEGVLKTPELSMKVSCETIDLSAPLLSLFKKELTGLSVLDNGDLEIVLSDGYHLYIAASDNFEAWEVNSNKGLLIVCTLGGAIGIWD